MSRYTVWEPLRQTAEVDRPCRIVFVGGVCVLGGKPPPFKGRILNYRTIIVDGGTVCTFGILVNKWRIVHRQVKIKTDFAEDIKAWAVSRTWCVEEMVIICTTSCISNAYAI